MQQIGKLCTQLYNNDLSSFIAKSFTTINPGTEYLPNWHIDLIAEYLQATTNGQIKRLIINMPPRALKSVCVSVAWPAWLIGNNPATRIMSASYSQILSLKHSLDCRHIINSKWYKNAFPKVQLVNDQNEKSKFTTSARGFRFATSVGGTATGEGGNYLIVDDPHNPTQAQSQTYREAANSWFEQTFSTRLDDKKNGVIVLVMQRLHPEDLSGHLLQHNTWEHLKLPAFFETPTLVQCNAAHILHQQPGDSFLHTNREGNDEIARVKTEIGSYGFNAQYMQAPVSKQSAMVQAEWLKYYNADADIINVDGKTIISWDTAIKTGNEHDYSVGLCIKQIQGKYYVIDMLRGKYDYPTLITKIKHFASKWQPNALLIEDKASGQSLLQNLKADSTLPLIGISPTSSKEIRFGQVTPLMEAGKLYLPRNTGWLGQMEAEIMGFPNLKHDDIVDCLSQALNWLNKNNMAQPTIRRL